MKIAIEKRFFTINMNLQSISCCRLENIVCFDIFCFLIKYKETYINYFQRKVTFIDAIQEANVEINEFR